MCGHDDRQVPFFSVVMPAYNASRTIADAIGSVLAQTDDRWELVIVDDGSSDATLEIARDHALRDSRILVLRQAHGGAGAARARAVEHSRGRYIARLDADDLYLPHYMQTMRSFIETNPGYGIYACNAEVFFPDGRVEPWLPEPRFEAVLSLDLDDLLRACHIFTASAFDRALYDLAGGFRAHIYNEDYDFWLRAMAGGARHIYTPAVLARYRVSESQMSADRRRAYDSDIRIMRDLIRSGPLVPRQVAIARSRIRELHGLQGARAREGLRLAAYGGDRSHLPRDLWDLRWSIRERAEAHLRSGVEQGIRLMRSVFPPLRKVRLRKGS